MRSDGLALAGGDASRRSEVERRDELGAVALEHPGSTLLARHIPAEELLEDFAVGAYERRVRQVDEEREQIVDG